MGQRFESFAGHSFKCRIRLTVRTQGFHPCNSGSIPLFDVLQSSVFTELFLFFSTIHILNKALSISNFMFHFQLQIFHKVDFFFSLNYKPVAYQANKQITEFLI